MPFLKVRIEAGTETAGDGLEIQEKELTDAQKQKQAIVSAFTQFAVSQARNAISYGINSYGKFTGDQITQRKLQNDLETLGDVITIGSSIATGNPAIMAITIASMATGKIMQAVDYTQTVKLSNYESNFLISRAGNGLINGSRGTEN